MAFPELYSTMFRHSNGIDLNDFPALGAPQASNRGNATTSMSSLQPSRLASYATTAGANANVNHLQEALVGNGAASMPDFSLRDSSSLGSYQPPLAPRQSGYEQLTTARGIAPRTFSVDEFPALQSSTGAFGDNSPMNKQESWLSYNGMREGIASVNGTYGCSMFSPMLV